MLANRPALDIHATRAMRRVNVWRVATVLIEQFGDEARRVAEACAGALDDMGDNDLGVLWKRVANSIIELERAPGRGETVN